MDDNFKMDLREMDLENGKSVEWARIVVFTVLNLRIQLPQNLDSANIC